MLHKLQPLTRWFAHIEQFEQFFSMFFLKFEIPRAPTLLSFTSRLDGTFSLFQNGRVEIHIKFFKIWATLDHLLKNLSEIAQFVFV